MASITREARVGPALQPASSERHMGSIARADHALGQIFTADGERRMARIGSAARTWVQVTSAYRGSHLATIAPAPQV